MKVVRLYRCPDCHTKFRRTMERDAPEPACPSCSKAQPSPPDRIAAPSIVTTKGRAVDIAYDIVSEDYGLTNLRDGAREGDTAVILPPAPKPGTVTGPSMIWGGAAPSTAPLAAQLGGTKEILSGSRGAAALANAEGRNPLRMLHQQHPRLQAIPVNKE